MLLNLDWLQIHCKGNITDTKRLKFQPSGYGTKQFKTVGKLLFDKEEVATVSMHPHSELANGGMSSDTVLIKFSNKKLYQSPESLKTWIFSILNEVKDLKIVGLSRIDIALDFNTFLNGYEPAQMIKDFCREDILKNSRGNFKTEGTHNRQIKYHYLRYGNHNSERSIYLYNKTKEMNEKTRKPHIERSWKQCAEIDPTKEVWRLELSMKGNKHRLLIDEYKGQLTDEDFESGKYIIKKQITKDVIKNGKVEQKTDLYDLEVNEAKRVKDYYNINHNLQKGYCLFRNVRFIDLLDGDFLKQLYFTCIYQNFTFVYNDKQKNKSRMKSVHLFNQYCEYNKIQSLPESKDATRSNRIFIKHLHNHIQDLKGMNDVLIEDTKNVDSNIFTDERMKEAIEQLNIISKSLKGGEDLLSSYAKLYDLEKYIQRVRQLRGD